MQFEKVAFVSVRVQNIERDLFAFATQVGD